MKPGKRRDFLKLVGDASFIRYIVRNRSAFRSGGRPMEAGGKKTRGAGYCGFFEGHCIEKRLCVFARMDFPLHFLFGEMRIDTMSFWKKFQYRFDFLDD